jgi:hypothetical protein
MTQTERAWLREHRSPAAAHWNLLTDMKEEHLAYASEEKHPEPSSDKSARSLGCFATEQSPITWAIHWSVVTGRRASIAA